MCTVKWQISFVAINIIEVRKFFSFQLLISTPCAILGLERITQTKSLVVFEFENVTVHGKMT